MTPEEDQTEKAFTEDFGTFPDTGETPKGKGYIELLVDNIVGLDNDYESFGEAFGKSFNEDELGTLKNMAVSAYEGAKEFATSPIETSKDIATEISDSFSRLGTESLDGRLKRMYGIGYQDATEEQVTKAREAVIGDAITASSLVPTAKGATTIAKAAIPGKLQADVVGQMRSLLDGDKEFRTESKKPAQSLSAQAVGKPESRIPFFKKKEVREGPNSPDAMFGTKTIKDVFEEDKTDKFDFGEIGDLPEWGDETNWTLESDPDGYDVNKLGYARNTSLDSLARYKLGQIDLQELADQVGSDADESFVEYINNRLTRLSNNPEFVDYTQRLESNPSFDARSVMGSQPEPGKIVFMSPVPEALNSMTWPSKGKEGYQIISELQKNPSIRKAELDTVLPEIDPQKRYTVGEVQELVKGNLWNTEVKTLRGGFDSKYDSYQRQNDLQDPEVDYFELVIDSKREGQPSFKAKNQHFDESTLAHARASVRADTYTGKEYILGEELQTDLLQHGYDSPTPNKERVTPEEAVKRTAAAREEVGLNDRASELLLQMKGESLRYDLFFDSPVMDQFIEEVGPENLLGFPGATITDVYATLRFENPIGSADFDTLAKLYANYKVGKPGKTEPVNNDAWDIVDNISDFYWNVVSKQENYQKIEAVSAPPIKKIEESVKMTLGALMAEADKRNIDTIVIPPLERIVAKRFTPGSESYKKAMDPKSGFYKTYVKSLRGAIKELEDEFGRDKVSSRPVDMAYDSISLNTLETPLVRSFGYSPDNGWEGYLDSEDFHQDLRTYFIADDNDTLPASGLTPQEFKEILRNLRIKGLKHIDIHDFGFGEFRPLSKFMQDRLGEEAPVTGTEIYFKGLRDSGYDLTKLKFAQGGLVGGLAQGGMVEDEQTEKAFAEGGFNLRANETSESKNLDASGEMTFKNKQGSVTPGLSYSKSSYTTKYPDGVVVDENNQRVGLAVNGELYLDDVGKNKFRAGLSREIMSGNYQAKLLDEVIGKGAIKEGVTRLDLGADLGKFSVDFSKSGDNLSGSATYRLGPDSQISVEDSNSGEPLFRFDLRKSFAEGGMVEDEQMNRLMQEGGMADDGMSREPVTGNEIPPGSLASEVRDDIPAQLSEGEYVVPADVLRYFGVRFFEELRTQAKQGMMQMESEGRIGGTPVDAQGVPSGEVDEELTPEEEQMLREALGGSRTAPTGMAYGGMTEQPISTPYQDQATMYQMPQGMATGGVPFDRTKFTMGTGNTGMIETKRYINPTTKEERTVNFLNGIPLGIIPEGFVPWTQELADQPKPGTDTDIGTPEVKVKSERGEGTGAERGQPTTGEGSMGWAEKNYDAVTSDPLGFATGVFNDANKPATGLGKMVGMTGLGRVANDIDTLSAISQMEAAKNYTKPGSSEEKAIQGMVDTLSNSLDTNLANALYGVGAVATGNKYTNDLNKVGETRTAISGTATSPATTGTKTNAGAGNASAPAVGGYERPGGRDQQGSTGNQQGSTGSGIGQDKDKPGGNTGIGTSGTGGGGADAGQAANPGGNKSFGGELASNRGGGNYAPGGLITRPKKAVLKKPKKGLAS